MLTIEDCIGLSELTPEEIEAIALHEHIPDMAAIELGFYLKHKPGGALEICRMILEDIDQAYSLRNIDRVARLKVALRHIIETRGH